MSIHKPKEEKKDAICPDLGSGYDETLFCEIGEQKDEEICLPKNECDQSRDLKIGWKPESLSSGCGRLGELYDMPGTAVAICAHVRECHTYE